MDQKTLDYINKLQKENHAKDETIEKAALIIQTLQKQISNPVNSKEKALKKANTSLKKPAEKLIDDYFNSQNDDLAKKVSILEKKLQISLEENEALQNLVNSLNNKIIVFERNLEIV